MLRKLNFLLLLILMVVACYCTGSSGMHSKSTENVFRYNESKGISTLDPAFARNQTIIWPVNQLFNGLLQMDRNLWVQPCIAKRWTVSSDGKEYRFVLRRDVYFHDDPAFPGGVGRRVTAYDFAYSFSRLGDPSLAAPGAWVLHILDKDSALHPTGFLAENDTVFHIWLKHPFPAFAGLLTMQYCAVVPREAVVYYGDRFGHHPVGTGPFRFKYWKDGEKLILIKNKKYFEKDSLGKRLPYLDAVSIRFIYDKQSEFLEFISGNLDFLSGVNAASKDELLTRSGRLNPKYEKKFHLSVSPYLNTEYLGFLMDTSMPSTKNSPLKIKRIRQAINEGFDRRKMMKYLRNNIGTPALHGFVPEGLPSFSKRLKGYDYNPGHARELLRDAGYPDGEGLSPITLTTTSDYLDLCEYIQHELAVIGILLRIDVNTGASYRNNVANARLPFFRGSWIADYPDAENYLALFYSKNFSPGGPNYTHFSNAVYDSLYEKAMTVLDESKRFSLYQEMDSLIIREAVVVPLYYDEVVRFYPVNISGLEPNPMNLLILKTVKKN